MKRFLLWILLGLHISPALCMESEALIESNPLYIAELRLLITQRLWTELSISDALKTIRAWALTDTTAWRSFQTSETAHLFIDYFNRFSYYNGYAIALLQNYKALLDQEELALFNQSLQTGSELVKLFDTCAEEKKWDAFLTQVPVLEKATLSKYLAHYYWESTYREFYAQKTLLLYALELQAPQEVIDALIKWGSRLRGFNEQTPPPCLIVCQNLLNITADYERKGQEQPADRDSLKEEFECTVRNLKDTLTRLIERKAYLDEFFIVLSQREEHTVKQVITPLFIAAKANNLDLVKYLHEKGAFFDVDNLDILARDFAKNRISYRILEILLSEADSWDLHYALNLILDSSQLSKNEKEEDNYCKLLALILLNKNSDINAIDEGLTPLDRFQAYQHGKYYSKIADLLIQHGAVLATKSENLQKITDLKCKTTSYRRGKTTEERLAFLEEIKNLLLHEELTLPSSLISEWLRIALGCWDYETCSEQGKEFWKFIALSFPRLPLFSILVKNIYRFKEIVDNDEEYQPYLKEAQDLIAWLIQEGIKDTQTPPALDLAKALKLEELVSSLTSALPNP